MPLQVFVLRALVPRGIHTHSFPNPHISNVAAYWTYESSEEIKMLTHPCGA